MRCASKPAEIRTSCGAKSVAIGIDDVLEQGEPDLLARAGGDRQVDRVPLPSARAEVVGRPGPRVKPVLVEADEEHVGAAPEGLGGAVAVVDVPVEHQDPLRRRGRRSPSRRRSRRCRTGRSPSRGRARRGGRRAAPRRSRRRPRRRSAPGSSRRRPRPRAAPPGRRPRRRRCRGRSRRRRPGRARGSTSTWRAVWTSSSSRSEAGGAGRVSQPSHSRSASAAWIALQALGRVGVQGICARRVVLQAGGMGEVEHRLVVSTRRWGGGAPVRLPGLPLLARVPSSSRRSAEATSRRVCSTASRLTEIASIPAPTRRSAYSGYTDGAWPQIEVPQPELARALDQPPDVGRHRRVELVEGLGDELGVAVDAEQELGQVVGADRDPGYPQLGVPREVEQHRGDLGHHPELEAGVGRRARSARSPRGRAGVRARSGRRAASRAGWSWPSSQTRARLCSSSPKRSGSRA